MEDFRAKVEKFLADHPELSGSALGAKALNDSGFVSRLKRGKANTTRTVARVEAWMKEYAVQARKAARQRQRAAAKAGG